MTIDVATWEPGDYTWFVRVSDLGFSQNTVETDSYTLIVIQPDDFMADTEAPVLQILQPTILTRLSGEVRFEAEASDNVGIQQVTLAVSQFEYSMVPIAEGRYAYTLDTSLIPDGEYTGTITATDVSGLSTSLTITLGFENGNDKGPADFPLPLQIPWFAICVSIISIRMIRKRK